MLKLRTIAFAVSILLPGVVLAQSVDPVQYLLAPETPGPNAPVTITVQGVGGFLGDSNISWSVNGTVTKSGVGLTTFSFTTGALGQSTVVRVSINSATQGLISKTFTFNPSTINLVWEADTSVPPMYKGRALYSAGAGLKVVAFPTVILGGRRIAAESLSYRWEINGEPITGVSGTGKYVLSYQGDQLQDGEVVAVDVYAGSLKVGRGEIAVPTSVPQVVFYARDPLRGVVWDSALPARIALNDKEFTVFAQPYFFSNQSVKNNFLSWEWTLNGQTVTGPQSDKGILTLRQTGEGQGNAEVSVAVQNQNTSELIQSAQAALSILFGQSTSIISSLFGI